MKKLSESGKQNGIITRGITGRHPKLKLKLGAGDGTRTRDSLLGGQELYQLSYSRAL